MLTLLHFNNDNDEYPRSTRLQQTTYECPVSSHGHALNTPSQLNEYRIWEHRAFEVGQGEANNMTQLTALMYDVDVEVNNLPKVMKY